MSLSLNWRKFKDNLFLYALTRVSSSVHSKNAYTFHKIKNQYS